MLNKAATKTRNIILERAFHIIHRKGYRSTGLSEILKHTKLTKGAFYYHFPTKKALGYAIIEELLNPMTEVIWLNPLKNTKDPIKSIKTILRTTKTDKDSVLLGCPLNNLAVEMAPIDEGFRMRLEKVYEKWIAGFANALILGQKNNKVSKKISPRKAASFIVASMAGCRSIAKNTKSQKTLLSCGRQLERYLDTLKP